MYVKTCEVCSKPYNKKPGVTLAQWSNSKFCSRSCTGKYRKGRERIQHTTLEERFWSKVDKSKGHGPKGDCWPWLGYKDSAGYGAFRSNGKIRKAHRISFRLKNKKYDPALDVCHSCDFPPCVRPSHLFQGTNQDNMTDMVMKGRSNAPRGERHHAAILTAPQVRMILRSKRSPSFLSKLYGVQAQTITAIRKRRIWRHINEYDG